MTSHPIRLANKSCSLMRLLMIIFLSFNSSSIRNRCAFLLILLYSFNLQQFSGGQKVINKQQSAKKINIKTTHTPHTWHIYLRSASNFCMFAAFAAMRSLFSVNANSFRASLFSFSDCFSMALLFLSISILANRFISHP